MTSIAEEKKKTTQATRFSVTFSEVKMQTYIRTKKKRWYGVGSSWKNYDSNLLVATL